MPRRLRGPCPTPGCPNLADCETHRKQREQLRGTTTARGYGSKHQRLRAMWQARMDKGELVTCWRCREQRGIIHHVDPANWHLGHDDQDRSRYRGPECPVGNLATKARG